MIAYKFLRKGLKSNYDGSPWEIGKWREVPAPTGKCVGLNASKLIQDALSYVQGEILAKVEYGGEVVSEGDKLTCQKMRVLAAWDWDKHKSVQLAIYSAELVIGIYEKQYPGDNRPRQAIEAAKAYIKAPARKNAAAAYAAARAAAAAAYAAAHAGIGRKIHLYALKIAKEAPHA